MASLAEVIVAWLSGRHNSPPLQEILSRDLRGSERGKGLVTNLAVLLILACSSRRGRSNTLMSSFLYFKSPWSSCHPFFGFSIVLWTRPRGKTPEERISKSWASDGELHGKYIRYPTSCILVNSLSAIYDGTKFQTGRQSFDAWNRVWKGVQSNENKYCVWYQNRSLGRWPVNCIRSQARGITLTKGCTGEWGFDPVELWVMGPPCGLKVGRVVTSFTTAIGRHCYLLSTALDFPEEERMMK